MVLILHQDFQFLRGARYYTDLNTLIVFFFVLSSFLITEILMIAKRKALESGYTYTKTAFAFLIRRALRIFPAYYFYLIAIMLLPVVGLYLRQHAGVFFFYVGNFRIYADQFWEPVTAHLWTLSIEEQFYIVWPWLILFIPDRHLPRLFYVLIAAGTLFRVLFVVFNPSSATAAVSPFILTPGCLDAFGYGGLLAYWHVHGRKSNPVLKKICWVLLPVWLLSKIGHVYVLSAGVDRATASLISMIAIEGASNGYKNKFGKFLESRIVTYLGKISYGMYLYHLIVPILFWRSFFWLGTIIPSSLKTGFGTLQEIVALPVVNFFVYLFLTIGFASASWYFLELPVNNLKRYIGYTRPKARRPDSTAEAGQPTRS